MYTERFYREKMGKRFKSFIVRIRETDLWIGIDNDSFSSHFVKIAYEEVENSRKQIIAYAATHDNFYTSFSPLSCDSQAPQIVKKMLCAGQEAHVGPMAAVAGAIAQKVGYALLKAGAREVIVENGGDLFLKVEKPIVIGIFSGNSPLNGKVFLEIKESESPCGVCTSSATVGHSFSFGKADAVTIISKDAAIADGLATRYCNEVKSKKDVKRVLQTFKYNFGGMVVIVQDVLGSVGKNVHFVGETPTL